jgi:hypothetical protein
MSVDTFSQKASRNWELRDARTSIVLKGKNFEHRSPAALGV